MKLKATIDIGSNSILLLLVNLESDNLEILENHSNITGLGRDLDKNGVFIDESMNDSLIVLKKYAQICNTHGIVPEKVIVTATEASRVAGNASNFFNKVKSECGLIVRTITAQAEPFYSTTGILLDKNITSPQICIMDIGGASTELIKVKTSKREIIDSFSMPVGAVRMNNWKQQGERNIKLDEVLSDFAKQLIDMKCDTLYCVAGTMTSVGNIYLNNKTYKEDQVNGLIFSVAELDQIIKKFNNYTAAQFLEQFPFLGKRSNTIMSGLLLANAILNKLAVKQVYISTYGLRYGTIVEDYIPTKCLSK